MSSHREAVAEGVMSRSSPPRLSIMTVTWNGWQDTQRCLDSIAASALPDHEIMVIDNASQDGTPDHIERLFPNVRIVRNQRNVGHTRAVNQGVRLAQGEYVLLLDSDTELRGNAIQLMLDLLETRPDIGMVTPRTYNSDGSIQATARRFPNALSGLFGRQSVLTRWFPNNPVTRHYLQTDGLTSTSPYEVEQISGACMLFRRSLFDAAGPWDEGYFAYWVDTDWCFKVRRCGWRIYCLPQASVVHHEQNHAGRKKSVRRIWIFHYGAYRFYRNNMTLGTFDPRAIAAFLALSLHGLFQFAQNVFVAETSAARPSAPKQQQ